MLARMILIIDDMSIVRDPIAACLKLGGYETICASDGREGLEMAKAQLPDLILLDMSMPGMDGIQVLKQLRGEPTTAATPVLILSVVADRERVLDAISCGAQEYILKSSFSTKTFLARIERHLPRPAAAAQNPNPLAAQVPAPVSAASASPPPPRPCLPILDGEKSIQRIRRATRGKALSGIVAEVIAMAASQQGDSADLAKLIGSDPVLTARVLGAANSAGYATHSGLCMTVTDAVRKIGFSGVRNITAAVGIFDSVGATTEGGFNPVRYWQHSVAVAQLCESLVSADMRDATSPGHAYICGLCHDLGEILVLCEFDEEYRQVIETQRLTGRPREELRREMLGLSHASLVAEASLAMGLPKNIREPIENFHADRTAREKVGPLPGILRMMDRYANGLLLAADSESKIEVFDRAYVRSVLGNDKFVAPDPESLCSQVRSLTATAAPWPGKLS
jgi:CheY-like chemotaxis protein/HD-like signal output (HDOD) protein